MVWVREEENKKIWSGWKAFETNIYFVQRSAIRHPATVANGSILNDGLHTERTYSFFNDFSSLMNEHISHFRNLGETEVKVRLQSSRT
jgi:hypothetical protein